MRSSWHRSRQLSANTVCDFWLENPAGFLEVSHNMAMLSTLSNPVGSLVALCPQMIAFANVQNVSHSTRRGFHELLVPDFARGSIRWQIFQNSSRSTCLFVHVDQNESKYFIVLPFLECCVKSSAYRASDFCFCKNLFWVLVFTGIHLSLFKKYPQGSLQDKISNNINNINTASHKIQNEKRSLFLKGCHLCLIRTKDLTVAVLKWEANTLNRVSSHLDQDPEGFLAVLPDHE